MEYSETKVNDQITARVYYSKAGRMIYLIDNSTDEEIAEVRLLGLDLGSFCDILNSGSDNNI